MKTKQSEATEKRFQAALPLIREWMRMSRSTLAALETICEEMIHDNLLRILLNTTATPWHLRNVYKLDWNAVIEEPSEEAQVDDAESAKPFDEK